MKLSFVIHCHQPVGNFDRVIEDVVDRAYLPFLEVVAEHRAVPVGVHYSGTLLQWAIEHRPDLIEHLRGPGEQIEFLGGGIHEPILSVLPDGWRRRQIEHLTDLIEDTFEQSPTGVWLAERVWEPTLAWVLDDLGFDYTVLDQSLFDIAGADPRRPTVVEHLGHTLAVLPIDRHLRRGIPGMSVEAVMDHLHQIHRNSPDALVVMADDGEKFGDWPGTADRVYGQGWLTDLFGRIAAADWIDLLAPSDAVADSSPLPAALPAGSYSEMNRWTRPHRAPRRSDDDFSTWPAPWKTFLTRYPEANTAYRKMLSVAGRSRLPDEAVASILAAQSNDAYWHGAFGGIYLPHLRTAVHEHLIRARVASESTHRTRNWSDLTIEDWDADGRPEIHVELPDQSWVLDADGSFFYYDDKPSAWPVSAVMSRHREPYHTSPQDGDGIARRWLADRHAPAGARPETLGTAHRVTGPYELGAAESSRGTVRVRLVRERGETTVVKAIRATGRKLELSYELAGMTAGRFGPELPISVWDGAGTLRVDGGAWQPVDGPAEYTGHRFRFRHQGRNAELLVDLRKPGELFLIPLCTVVQSEQGIETITQGVVLWPHFLTDGTGDYQMSIEVFDVEREESPEEESE